MQSYFSYESFSYPVRVHRTAKSGVRHCFQLQRQDAATAVLTYHNEQCVAVEYPPGFSLFNVDSGETSMPVLGLVLPMSWIASYVLRLDGEALFEFTSHKQHWVSMRSGIPGIGVSPEPNANASTSVKRKPRGPRFERKRKRKSKGKRRKRQVEKRPLDASTLTCKDVSSRVAHKERERDDVFTRLSYDNTHCAPTPESSSPPSRMLLTTSVTLRNARTSSKKPII